ncbi:PQQ-binding-like beta-propeller repeat protein [Egicoccus sp. AB-alg6-2]|uniref:outer membrane protein assembly factor BamB family protein n=1 Tax=Egicoccus sp. AB-alg6-2 TaxID=3242692 RepID=UPI00359DB7DA
MPVHTTPRPGWRALLAVASVVAIAVTGTAVLRSGMVQLPRDRPDPVVELAQDTIVPQGSPLSDEERARALAPFDPTRMRCEPQGCERWRVEMTPDRNRRAEVATFGDLVVTVLDQQIRAYDLQTGEPRWHRSWPADAGSRGHGGWTMLVPALDDEVLLIGRPDNGSVLALGRDGAVLWHQTVSALAVHDLTVFEDVLVLGRYDAPGVAEGGEIEEPVPSLWAVDLRTGQTLWERPGSSLLSYADPLIVREQGEAVLLDPLTGEERARRTLGDDTWIHHVGEAAILQRGSGREWDILDPTTLETRARLEGLNEISPTSDRSLLVGSGAAARAEGGAAHILLIELDGTVRWTHEVEGRRGVVHLCCPEPRVADGALVIPSPDGGNEALRLSLVDGRPVAAPAGPELEPFGDDADQPWWWISEDTAVAQGYDRLRLWHDGREVQVRGEGVWPTTVEPPFLFTNGRSLMSVEPLPPR